MRAVGDWDTFPQPLKVRGEATVFPVDPAPAGEIGGLGGVSGPILAAMMRKAQLWQLLPPWGTLNKLWGL